MSSARKLQIRVEEIIRLSVFCSLDSILLIVLVFSHGICPLYLIFLVQSISINKRNHALLLFEAGFMNTKNQ